MTARAMETAGKRLPCAIVAPAARSRVAAFHRGPTLDAHKAGGWTASAFMHNFGRVSVHVPGRGAELADDSACASGKFGKNGGTGCDASAGKTVTTIYDPPACYRHCVERHEAVHARDIAPCCTRANSAYKAAKSDDDRQKVQDKFDQWMLSNQDWLECRAYTESAKCGQEYVDKNCGAKKQDAGTSGVPGQEVKPPVSLEPQGNVDEMLKPGATDLVRPAGDTRLAEDKLDGGAGSPSPVDKPDGGAPAPTPEQCCRQVACYARVSQGRADNVCSDAPKALSKCPF